jgi:hypothetical protein
VSSRLTIEAVTDGLQFCLPWPRQHQKLLSNLSHLWQPLSREMRQSLLTQRLLAWGKKFLLKKKFELSTDHTAFHSSCSLAHPSPTPH